MKASGLIRLYIAGVCILAAQSFTFARFNSRRPRTRLFGTTSQLASPRYNTEPRRAYVRPFRIPGFESSPSRITSSRASKLGFDIGLGGRALSDPIASMYDSASGNGGFGFINSVGDGGGGGGQGGGDIFVGVQDPLISNSLGFNDGFNTAANSRDLKMLGMNFAESRLRQPLDIGNFGHHDQSQLRNFNLNMDNSGLGSEGSFMLSGNGGRQQNLMSVNQMSLESNQQPLNSFNQLRLEPNSLLGLDTNSGGLNTNFNQIRQGIPSSDNIGIISTGDKFSVGAGELDTFGRSQINLGSNQLGSSVVGNQIDVDTNQLGLGTFTSNLAGFNSGQASNDLSSLGVPMNNQLTGLSSQQSFLGQSNGMGAGGNTQDILGSHIQHNHVSVGGLNTNHLSSTGVENNLRSGLSNQLSTGSNLNVGLIGADLQTDPMSAVLPTQMTVINGQYLSATDRQALGLGQQSEGQSREALGVPLKDSLSALPFPTSATAGIEVMAPAYGGSGVEGFSSRDIGQFVFDGGSAGAAASQLSSGVISPSMSPTLMAPQQNLSPNGVNRGISGGIQSGAGINGQMDSSSLMATITK
ncbi:hypothetical protein PoB_003710300 [Plakobranchus ocellatus]|uniref:Uncharacterized protein n=1 Tax=Plakobranchus ocellatus TaxID=259542 RepID=A0AAV4AT78_9GAST|nr:hypothetical protein PoB_003710300 [Plakobranchus ocellatus]